MAQRVGVFFKGTLSKKSPHTLRGYQDRFFTIDHRTKQLNYYLSEEHFNNGLADKASTLSISPSGPRTYHIRAPTAPIAEQWAIKFIQTRELLGLPHLRIIVSPAIMNQAMNLALGHNTPFENSSASFALLHSSHHHPPPPPTQMGNGHTPFTSPRSLQASQQQQSRDQQQLLSQKSSLGTHTTPNNRPSLITSGSYTQGSTLPSSNSSSHHDTGSSSFDIDEAGFLGRSVSNLADFAEDSLGMKLLQMQLGATPQEKHDSSRPIQYGTVQKLRPQKGLLKSFNSWQSRYLVLTGVALSYYESESVFQKNPKNAKSVLHTHLLSDVRRVEDNKKEYKFQVTHNPGNGEQPRVYQFKVSEEYTLNEWVLAISKVIKAFNSDVMGGVANAGKNPLYNTLTTPTNPMFSTPTMRPQGQSVLNSPSHSSLSSPMTPQFSTQKGGLVDTNGQPPSAKLDPLQLTLSASSGTGGGASGLTNNTTISQTTQPNQQTQQLLGEDDIRHHGWLTKREKDGKFFQSGKKARLYYVLTGRTFSCYESIPPTVTHPHLNHQNQFEPIEEIHFNTIRNANSAKAASGKTKEKIKEKNIDTLFVLNTNHESIIYAADTPSDAETWINAFFRANTERIRNQHNTASLIAGKMNKMLSDSKRDPTSANRDEQHQTNTGERFREVDQLTFSVSASYNRHAINNTLPVTTKGNKGLPSHLELHHQQIQSLIQDTKNLLEMGQAKNIESKNENPNWFAVMYVYTAEQATPLDVNRYRQRFAQSQRYDAEETPSKKASATSRQVPSNNNDDDDENNASTPAQGSIVAFDSSLHTNPAFSHFRTLYPVPPYSATPTGLGVGIYSEGGDRNKPGNEPALQQALAQRSLSIGRVCGELCNIDGLYVEYWREVSRTEIRRPVYFEDLEQNLQTSAIQYSTPLFSTFSTSSSLITTPTIIPASVNIQTGLITTLANHTFHQNSQTQLSSSQHLHPGGGTQLSSPVLLQNPNGPSGNNGNPLATALASNDATLTPSYAVQLLNKELFSTTRDPQNPFSLNSMAQGIFDDSDRRGVLFESHSSFIAMNCLLVQPPFIPLTTSSQQMVSLAPQHDSFLQTAMKHQLSQLLENGQKYIGKPQHLTLSTDFSSTYNSPSSPTDSNGPDSLVVSELLPPQQQQQNCVIPPLPHVPQPLRLYKDANMDIPLQFQTIPMSLLKQANQHAFQPKIISNDHYMPFDPTISPLTTAAAPHFVDSSYYPSNSAIPALVASASTINNVNWQLGPAQLSPYTLLGPKANRFSSLLTLFVPSKSAPQHHTARLAANARKFKDDLNKVRSTGLDEFVEILATLSTYLDSRALRLSKYYDRHSAQAYQQWIDIKFAAQQLLKYIRNKNEQAKLIQSQMNNNTSVITTGSNSSFGSNSVTQVLSPTTHASSLNPSLSGTNNHDDTFSISSVHSAHSAESDLSPPTRQRSSVMMPPPPPSPGCNLFGGLPSVTEDNTNRDGTCMVEEMVLLDTLPIQRRTSRAPSVLVTPFISSGMGLRKGHVSSLSKKWETQPSTTQQPNHQGPPSAITLPKTLTSTSSTPAPTSTVVVQTGIIAQPRDSAAPTSFISDDYNSVKALTRMHLERKLQRTSISTTSSPLDQRRGTRVFQNASRLSRSGNSSLTPISEKNSISSTTVDMQTGEMSMDELDHQMGKLTVVNEPSVEMPISIDEGNEEDEDYEDDHRSLAPISGGLSCAPSSLPGTNTSQLPLDDIDGDEDDEGDGDDDDDEDDGLDELELYDGWRYGSDPLLDRTLVRVCVYQTDAQDLYQSDLKNQRVVAEMTCTIGEILRNTQGNLSRPVNFHFERDRVQTTFPGTINVSFQHCLRTRIANTGRYTHGNFITRGSEYVPVTIDHSMDKMFNVDVNSLYNQLPQGQSPATPLYLQSTSTGSPEQIRTSTAGSSIAVTSPTIAPTSPSAALSSSSTSSHSLSTGLVTAPPQNEIEPQFWRPVSHMLPPIPTMQSYAVAGGQHLRTQEYDILCLESMQTSPHTFSVPAQVVKHAKTQRAKELQILREINDCLLLELRTLEEFLKLTKEDAKDFKKNGSHALPPGSVQLPAPSSLGEYDLFTSLQYPQLLTRAQNIIRRIVDKELAISSFLPNASASSLEPFILTHSLIVAHNLYANPTSHLNFTGLPGSEAALNADHPVSNQLSNHGPQVGGNQPPQAQQQLQFTRDSSVSISDFSKTNSQQVLSLRNNLYSFHAHRLAAILGDKTLLSRRIELIPTLQKQLKAKIAEYEKMIDFYVQVETIFDSYHGQYDDLFFKPSTTKVDEFLDFVGTNMHSQVIQFIKLPVNRPQLPLYHPPTELIPDLLPPAAQPLLHSSLISHLNQTYRYNHMTITAQSQPQQNTSTPLFSRASSVNMIPTSSNSPPDLQNQLYNLLPVLLPNTLPTTLQEFVSYKLPYTYSNQLLSAVSSTLHAHGLLSFLLSPHQQSESFSPFHAHTKGLLGFVPISARMNENGTNVSLPMADYGSNPTINGNWRYPAITHLVSTTAGALASHCDYAQYAGYWVDAFSKRIPTLKAQLLALTKGMKETHMRQQSDSENGTGDMSLAHDLLGGGKKADKAFIQSPPFVNTIAMTVTTLSDYHLIQFEREHSGARGDSTSLMSPSTLLSANPPSSLLSLSQSSTSNLFPSHSSSQSPLASYGVYTKLYANANFINRIVQQARQMNAIAHLIQQLEVSLLRFEQRKVPLISQALTALATTFCSALVYHSPTQLLDVVNCGFLFPLQSYITAHQDEFAMLSDFEFAAQALSHVKIRLVCKDLSTQSLESYSQRHQYSISVPTSTYQATPTPSHGPTSSSNQSSASSQAQPTSVGAAQFMLSPAMKTNGLHSSSSSSSAPGSTSTSAKTGGNKGNIFFNQSTSGSNTATSTVSSLNGTQSSVLQNQQFMGLFAPYCPDINGFGVVALNNNTTNAVMDVPTNTGTPIIPTQLQSPYEHYMDQLQAVYQDLSTPSLLYTLLTKHQGNLSFLGPGNNTSTNSPVTNPVSSSSNGLSNGAVDEEEKALQAVWNSLSYAARNLLNSQAVYQNSRQIKANQWLSAMSISFSSSNALDVTKFLATPHSQTPICSRSDIFDNSIISAFITPLSGLGYARLTPKFIPEYMKPIFSHRNRFFSALDLYGSRHLTRGPLISQRGSTTPLARHSRQPSDFLTKPFMLSTSSPLDSVPPTPSTTITPVKIELTDGNDASPSASPPQAPSTAGSESTPAAVLPGDDDYDELMPLCDGCGFVTCICDTLSPPSPFAHIESDSDDGTVEGQGLKPFRELQTDIPEEDVLPCLEDVPQTPSLSSTSSSQRPRGLDSTLALASPRSPVLEAKTSPLASSVGSSSSNGLFDRQSSLNSNTPPSTKPSTPHLFKMPGSNSKLASLAGVSTTKSSLVSAVRAGLSNLSNSNILIDDTTFRAEDPYTIMTIHLPPDLFYSLPPEVTGLPTATASTMSKQECAQSLEAQSSTLGATPDSTPRLAPSTPRSSGTKDLFKAAQGDKVGSGLLTSCGSSGVGNNSSSHVAQQTEVLIPVVSLLFTQGVNEFTGSLVTSSVASQAPKRQLEFNKRAGDVLIKYAMNYVQLLRYKPIFDRLLWAQAHIDCKCSTLAPGSSANNNTSALNTTASTTPTIAHNPILSPLGTSSSTGNNTISNNINNNNPNNVTPQKEDVSYWMYASCGRSDCQRSQITKKFLNEQKAIKDATAAAQASPNTTPLDTFKPLPTATATQLKHQGIEYGLDSHINLETLCNSSISSTTCYHCLRAMIDTFSTTKFNKCSNQIQQHLTTFQYTSTNAVNIYNQPVDAPPRSSSCGEVCSQVQPCPCLCSCHAFDICLCTPTSQCLSCSFAQICATNDAKICYIIQLVTQLQEAFKVPTTFRNLTIQTIATQLSRTMNGGEMLSCKSAKDRTSMAATWQTIRQLHALGVPQHQSLQLLEHLRAVGVRRGNVVKNTAKTNYAFSSLQRPFLPDVLKPHSATCSGKNVS